MAGALFERQLGTYASYHRDHRNRATHFIGIPAIVFSLLLALALWRFEVAGVPLSGAWLIGVLAVAGWVALDAGIGIAMGVITLAMILAAEWIVARYGAAPAWWLFALFFVGGWVFQLIGHGFEGRRPALADNLFQAFIGPMFLVAEAMIGLGLRPDLARAAEAAGPKPV